MGGISLINFAENCEVGGLPCGRGCIKHCNNRSVAMDDENFRSSAFISSDDSLRGFRKRWVTRPRSDASECFSDISGLQSEQSVVQGDLRLTHGTDHESWDDLGGYNAPSIHDSDLTGDQEPSHVSELGPEPPVEEAEVVQVAGDECVEFRWKCEALQSSAKRAKLYDNKFPWENPMFGGVFGRSDIFAGTIVSGYKHALAPTSIGAFEVLQSETIPDRNPDIASSSTTLPVSSIVLIGARREVPDEDIRRMALHKLRDLILGDPAATNLGISLRSMLDTGSVSHLIEQSFSDCFRAKASTTLQKRANSLWKLSKLLAANGVLTPLRFTEEDLYLAFCALRESKAGATSCQHIVEALHFLDNTAGFSIVDLGHVLSGRCRGVARDMFLGKDPLQQKHPLRVEHVTWLEELIQYSSPMHCCVIGQILFCVHAACRWRDSQRIQKLCIESSHNESLLNADAISSKTSLTLDAKTRFIPYAALGYGVGGNEDWAQKWLQSRRSEGLLMEEFILPSYSLRKGCWLDQRMSSSEATCFLREYLAQRFPGESLANYSSHSCKSTLLTWAGRSTTVIFTMPERRILGHHLDPNSKSVLTYSRESYTSLYAKVLLMYIKIRSGEFKPDLRAIDRVLQFAESSELVPELVTTGAEGRQAAGKSDVIEGPFEISDSESSVASDVELEMDQIGEGPDKDILGSSDFPGVPSSDMLVHSTSGLVHVVNEDGYLLCGRAASRNYKQLTDVSFAGHLESCQHCLRIFSRANPA